MDSVIKGNRKEDGYMQSYYDRKMNYNNIHSGLMFLIPGT